MKSNKEQIAELVKEMLTESYEDMLNKIDKVLNSGCVDIESWNKDNSPNVIFWQRFDQVKPQGDAEYLVCDTDGVIRVSYFDGINWGYLSTVKENITHWSILPQVPVI